ncbi:MAG TPA: diaminopimelate epimerase [Candidatus Eremiobacteraceae bacterium]|nr:diaminopimelate epimerase [Candidatus Eremiobacteraceae bacterium]
MPIIALTKCQGTGNDFLLFDARESRSPHYPELARALCDRRFGLGADGLLVLQPPTVTGADLSMRIFNADGSEAEMCGNGIRCVWRYLERETSAHRALEVQTATGIVRIEPDAGGTIRVEMGVPRLHEPLEIGIDVAGRTLRYAPVSMGNPHAVIFVDEPLAGIALDDLATAIASLDAIAGEINVEVALIAGGRIHMRVYERGVGETHACGTGACAVAAVAIASQRARSPVSVRSKGGDVTVAWDGAGSPAYLSGPAELVFDTTVEVTDDGRVRAIGRKNLTAKR